MSLLRTNYAGELAVLSTWLCGLLPWSVSYLAATDINTDVYWIRFLPLRFQFVQGPVSAGGSPMEFVWEIPDYVNEDAELAGWVWVGAVLVYLVILGFSVVYYVLSDRIEAAFPVDPARLLGLGLLFVGVILLAATWLFHDNQAGTTVPVGALITPILGALLAGIERE